MVPGSNGNPLSVGEGFGASGAGNGTGTESLMPGGGAAGNGTGSGNFGGVGAGNPNDDVPKPLRVGGSATDAAQEQLKQLTLRKPGEEDSDDDDVRGIF